MNPAGRANTGFIREYRKRRRDYERISSTDTCRGPEKPDD
jgi:hypothetical protein